MLTLLTHLAWAGILAVATSPTKPHVLYILLDDWGWADAGWHREVGQEEGVSTPNLDNLVREGIELTRHYAYKMCGPSRAAIQSGRNPIHVNVVNTKETYRNTKDPVSGWTGIPVNMTGLGEIMRHGGYSTHFYGKWDAGIATPLHTPMGRGYGKSLFYFHHQNDYWISTTQPKESDAGDTTCPGYPASRGPRDLWEDDHPARDLVNGFGCSQSNQSGCIYEDQMFADRVYAAIASHDTSTPLFIFWAPHAVHDPLEVPQAYADRFSHLGPPSGRWERQYYLAILDWIDEAIGNATQMLRTRGMWNSSFIIVHSDNGGPIYQGGGAGGNNWPLKGGKVSNWEGGIRVNALVSGGFLPPQVRGTRSEGLCAAWDWYATLAGLAGVNPFDNRAAAAGLPQIDSHDLWPMLSHVNSKSSRTELAIGTDGDFIGIGKSFKARIGGLIRGKYKILVQSVIPMSGWTGPVFPNLTRWDADYALQVCAPFALMGCLYDLDIDPSERRNLARDMPSLWNDMHARVRALELDTFSPDRGSADLDGACDTVDHLYDGFWGPWALLNAWPEARARGGYQIPSSGLAESTPSLV